MFEAKIVEMVMRAEDGPKPSPKHVWLDCRGRSSGDGSKPWYLVNPKIAGKWMFIPLKMYL